MPSSPSRPVPPQLARARVPRTQLALARLPRAPQVPRPRDQDYPLPEHELDAFAARRSPQVPPNEAPAQRWRPERTQLALPVKDHGYPVPSEARLSHHPSTVVVGANAEELAAQHLRSKGYFIIERNFRCKPGEIDVVAFRANPRYATSSPRRNASPDELASHRRLARAARMLVFVEIRSRADDQCGDAIEAIGPRKQRQVVRVAHYYLMLRKPDYDEIRFDALGITAGIPTLIEDAFWP